VCEHVFVSIKGGAYKWLRAALERRDLAGARSAAAELGRLNLADAASVVVLMARASDPAFERAAVRWLARLAAERPSIALDQFASAAAALAALRGTAHARAQLAAVCARQNITAVVGLTHPA
jgi:hypothetical protein